MVELKKSDLMSGRAGIENKIIRMPEALRTKLNVSLGEFITLNKIALQVDNAYNVDLSKSVDHAFVTDNVLKQVGVAEHVFALTEHITMGCDPELYLVDKTTSQLYNPGFLFNKNGPVGYDGMLAEIRPMPSVNQYEVNKHIFGLLTRLQNKLKEKNLTNIRMIARSSGWNMFAGFHVHMGIPTKLLIPTQKGFGKILRMIVKALDYYVGTLSVLAEGKDCTRRCSPFINYGKVSDFRVSARTLEYRVPGGALLKHPGLSLGLLSLCSLVAHDVIERLRIFTDGFGKDIDLEEDVLLSELYPNIVKSMDMYDVICSPSIERAKKEADIVKEDLKCMINYDCYSDSIKTFNKLSVEPISSDIWTNWSSY